MNLAEREFGRARPRFLPPPAAGGGRRPVLERVVAMLFCTFLVAVALGIGVVVQSLTHIENVLLLYVPVIIVAAVYYGFWTASWTALLSVAATSFFIAEPRFSFAVSEPSSVAALAIFLIAGALTSSLAAQARQRAVAADHTSRIVDQLYTFSGRLAVLSTRRELAAEIVRRIGSILHADSVLLLDTGAGLNVCAVHPPEAQLESEDMAAASACWDNRKPVNRNTAGFERCVWQFWPVGTADGLNGVVGICRERALSEDELRLLDALNDQAAVNLERTELAEEMRETEVLAETEGLRTALLTSISHDLRTPLASILGNISSLRKYGDLYDRETRAEMLEFAETETLRLSRFVDNVLHMTRIEAGALRPTIEMIDLSDAVGSALERVAKSLVDHDVRIELAGDLPMVPADFVLTEHVIVNLLDNAAKYSPKGSIIELRVRGRPGAVTVEVLDEGPGIPDTDMAHIFDRFFRVKVADHRPAGVGLGLAICKGFVEAMGGRISAANRHDRSGAVFTVTLPDHRPGERGA